MPAIRAAVQQTAQGTQRSKHEHLRQTCFSHLRFHPDCGTGPDVVGAVGHDNVLPGFLVSPAGPATGAPAATGKPMSRLELEAMIEKTAAQQREDLNWQGSIVDLMKLFKLDSSLGARKELAKELGYTGALDGSAEMNIWLHRQVMVKLAESGGKVPEHLKA
jgi:hypothetical protein